MTDWYQQSLDPPAAIEVRIRLGFVPERDHAQISVEAFDPTTRVQISHWSRPHFGIALWPQYLEEAVQTANELIAGSVEPF